MAWSPNEIPTAYLRAARKKSTTGQISQAAVAIRSLFRAFRVRWSFIRPGDQVSRPVNRGRAADVGPVPVYLLLLVFSPRTWSLPPGNNLGNNAEVALRADVWSATGPSRARGQLCRGSNNGDTAVVATPLT